MSKKMKKLFAIVCAIVLVFSTTMSFYSRCVNS